MFDTVLITTVELVVKYMLQFNAKALPSQILWAQSQQWEHQKNMWNLF